MAHPEDSGIVDNLRGHNMAVGFKFQVQRVKDGAGAHRLPTAWRS